MRMIMRRGTGTSPILKALLLAFPPLVLLLGTLLVRSDLSQRILSISFVRGGAQPPVAHHAARQSVTQGDNSSYEHEDHDWIKNWDREPSEDETGQRIFTAASEVMLYWPQSVVVQGHSIIPAVIAAGTVLYHGRLDTNVPTGHNWLAFDFEHAYFFAKAPNGYVHAFSTKRALRVIVFDGLSAHQARDTQQAFFYGQVLEDPSSIDPESGRESCTWAREHGIDGFVRTEMHFEFINCDFAGTMQPLSVVRVLPTENRVDRSRPDIAAEPFVASHTSSPDPLLPSPPYNRLLASPTAVQSSMGSKLDRVVPPEGWIGSFPTDLWIELDLAAKRHDFPPGETRVRPVFSKFVTFYDPALKSLLPGRRGKLRDHHRLVGIDKEEANIIMRQLEEAIDDEAGWNDRRGASGVDWASILRVVVEQYGERLEYLNDTLSVTSIRSHPDNSWSFIRALKARQQVLTILTPYFSIYDTPQTPSSNLSSESSLEPMRTWLAPVIQRCAITHTQGLPSHLFTKQEHLLYYGVRTVMREICRRLGRMFYLAYDIEPSDPQAMQAEEVYDAIAEAMRMEISSLIEWLDWVQVWVKCRPACPGDQYCLPSNGIPGDLPHRGPSGEYLGGRRSPQCVERPNV
ncbi:hypothetical protein DL93DRAFT_2216540 [Clavulina sp. PMI_390]|nr:hypothetical protein DL93DRAFT_2216540 [Clavulina sp. PMI_390]